MALLFTLKQNALDVASAEAKAAVYGWQWWQHHETPDDGVLFFATARRVPTHLGLTKRITRVLTSCAVKDVERTLQSLPWTKLLKGESYCVRLHGHTTLTERALAKIVHEAQKKPLVDLKNPRTTVDIVITAKRAYIGLLAWENTEKFEDRRAHLWVQPHPTSLHPALSRALLHLACAKRVHDPFCGAGGFLIEGSLAGMRTSGADISDAMIKRARSNARAFGIHPDLRTADAVHWVPRVPALVADLPYGKSTTPVRLQPLLEAFLLRAKKSTKRVILGSATMLQRTPGWTARARFAIYMHKGMTRHFVVLEAA